jgi:hypothetical protein
VPLYYLNLKRGSDELPNDFEPQDLPDLDTARAEAVAALREIAADAIRDGRSCEYDEIEIVGGDGTVLLVVTSGHALK